MRYGDYLGQALGPMALGPFPTSGFQVMYPIEIYQTQILDLTKTASGIELVPAKPGHYPVIFSSTRFLVEAVNGTQTTPAQMQAGSDAAHTNLFISSALPSNANVNAVSPSALPGLALGPALATDTIRRIPNATVLMDITAGAQGTGSFALRGKLSINVAWIAIG
jgi:hypothetical protein